MKRTVLKPIYSLSPDTVTIFFPDGGFKHTMLTPQQEQKTEERAPRYREVFHVEHVDDERKK